MYNENFLSQSTSLTLVIIISLIFTFLGLVYSKKYQGLSNYLTANRNLDYFSLSTSLVVSTIIIYAINFLAGFAGADYSFTNGEVFVIWILMAILVNNCFNK